MVQRLLLGLGLAAVVGLAQSLELAVEPAWPTPNDPIVLHIGGTWETLCTPREPQVFILGSSVIVRLVVPAGACPKARVSWRVSTQIGPLPPGLYEVVAELAGTPQSLGEIYVAYPDWLYWTSNRPLTWEDFRGPPPRRPGSAVAELHLDLGYEYSVAFRFDPRGSGVFVRLQRVSVYNRIDRNRSWVLPEHKNPDVLEHEQIHFDIHEVYRRLLQEELEGLAVRLEFYGFDLDEAARMVHEEIHRIYGQYQKKCQEIHELFDSDTQKYGPQAQRKWREKVDRWLRNPQEAPRP